jgi:hypothetical protein
MSDVHQCAQCELRFSNKSELDMHRMLDHPSKQEAEAEPVHDDDGGRVEE